MKRIAIIAAVVIAVLAVAIAAMPFVVPGDFLNQRVAARLSALTGRPVTLTGEPSLSIYPHFAITVGGLSIGDSEESDRGPLLVAETLNARVRLWTLLIGRIEFEEFELVKPVLRLVVGTEGKANWDFSESAVARQAAAPPPPAANSTVPPAPPPDLRLGRLHVIDGAIVYDDVRSNTREELTAVDLDLLWPTASAAVNGHGKMLWRGEAVEFTTLLAQPLELARGGASPARFAFASTPLRASFSGKASGSNAFLLEGEANVQTPSLRRVIEWMGIPMGTGPILGAGSISGSASLAVGSIGFSRAAIELDGNAAEGSVSVQLGGPRPVIKGALTSRSLDISAYLEAIRADLSAEGSWLIAPARLDFAEAIDADLSLSADAIVAGSARIGRTIATAGIQNGALNFVLQEARFHEGAVTLRMTADVHEETLTVNAAAKVADILALDALTDLAGVTGLVGQASLGFDLAASGRTWADVLRSITAIGSVIMANGSVRGFDMARVAESFADPLARPVEAGSTETAFYRLTANFAVRDGALGTEDLVMVGNGVRVSLIGDTSLFTGAVEARARVTTAAGTVPVTISGSLRAPVIAPQKSPAAP
jgi:uncharacterized protein involved in outer membrane biogenesis